jgi:hypothetical protein
MALFRPMVKSNMNNHRTLDCMVVLLTSLVVCFHPICYHNFLELSKVNIFYLMTFQKILSKCLPMLTSNSIDLSISDIIAASRKKAWSLYFFRCNNGSIRSTSLCLRLLTGSVGSSPRIVWISKSIRPL